MPGRTRLRIRAQRWQPDYFRGAADALASHRHVRRVHVNPQTASILIEHAATIAEIVADLGEASPFELIEDIAALSREIRPSTRPMAVGTVSALALGFMLLGAYQLRRGRAFGSASESLWNAYNAWRGLKMPSVAAALLGGGLLQVARGQILAPAASFLFYALNVHKAARKPGGTPGNGA
jgi:hypothetical protein